jgi:predicted Ser/Thr protein kinase
MHHDENAEKGSGDSRAPEAANLISELSRSYRAQFQEQRVILSFDGYVELVKKNPRPLIRSAAEYIRDTFNFFGRRELPKESGEASRFRFKLFDIGTEKHGPIIGGEAVQSEIYNLIEGFCRQGYANKLIMLHGPNGSAKSSTVEAIANGMSRYSHSEEGAVYSFNWIFPSDRNAFPASKGEGGPIGFGSRRDEDPGLPSYAMLDDHQIASKLNSEFKDNPIFLLPMPQRESWLREWIAAKTGTSTDAVELPPHLLQSGLSKRNQQILENLLSAYDGDLAKVLRHVQVERFFYSRQYRVGIATVEPQMAIDALEKQLTMDRNIANLPSVLSNIRYYESQGELVEANRGLLEFSDLLKRPLEAFKYLLTTVEKSSISLPSSTANLDIVFMASSNEKHLDAFKQIPDFSSFRGRFELVTVPYLLRPSLEKEIYKSDVTALAKAKKIAPHTVELLCTWAVMTRLKQPDPEYFDSAHRGLVARLDPRSKVRLYEGETLRPVFKSAEESILKELRRKIISESSGMVVYEGRFGASPREIRQILHRSTQSTRNETMTPMAMFDELTRIVKDRTVYEFLQFEPRGKYHDASQFISILKDEFADIFENETLASMSLVAEEEYEKLLTRYVENVVADVKKERIFNPSTEQYEPANHALMKEIEKIINVQGSIERHRDGLLSRMAAIKIDNPKAQIDVSHTFQDILGKIQEHYYNQRRTVVQANYQAMLALGADGEQNIAAKDKQLAQDTYRELERRFGYDYVSARECLKFMLTHNKLRKKTGD